MATAACFVGDAADGLPCEVDADCGLGVACELEPGATDRCCGGPCSVAPGTTSSTSVGSSETTEAGSTSGSDTGSTGSSSESSTTSSCGPPMVESETGECTLCGNGVLDPTELCDPELSDPGTSCVECSELTLLGWDETQPGDGDFDPLTFAFGGAVGLAWQHRPGGPWRSGPYFGTAPAEGMGLDAADGWPRSWLLSRSFSVPELNPETDQVRVMLSHGYDLSVDDLDNAFDHARVDLVEPSRSPAEVPPSIAGGIPVPLASQSEVVLNCGVDGQASPDGGCFPTDEPEPFCEAGLREDWARGSSDGPTLETVLLDAADVAGRVLQLSFQLRYDCRNFTEGKGAAANAWRLNAVSVVVERLPSE